jgi:hypothetical protein
MSQPAPAFMDDKDISFLNVGNKTKSAAKEHLMAFQFKQRKQEINWKQLAAVSVEKIIQTVCSCLLITIIV